eukprot:756792-Hanusia_phi.AAC.5
MNGSDQETGSSLSSWITKIQKKPTKKQPRPRTLLPDLVSGQNFRCFCHDTAMHELNGWHVVHDPSGDTYEGEWRGGLFSGVGMYHFANGSMFEGIFRLDCPQNGIFRETDGKQYEVQYDGNIRITDNPRIVISRLLIQEYHTNGQSKSEPESPASNNSQPKNGNISEVTSPTTSIEGNDSVMPSKSSTASFSLKREESDVFVLSGYSLAPSGHQCTCHG